MAYESLAEARCGIEDALARMLQVKKEGAPARGEIPELVTAVSVLFLNLRQMNRVILQEEDRVKSETEAAKCPLDHTSLQLHNLLYEKNHYLKAIKACKDFKSKYPDIELVPEEKFFVDAPEELQSDPALKTDPHKLMLQRLNFEMLQRKDLCKQRELLEARKKMLQETITNRKKFLSSLPSHLKALKKASLPVQQHLGILHTKRMKQHQLADLLPAPLYILYTQLLSYKEAFTEPIEVEITGSAKEAQMLLKQQLNRETGGGPAEVDEENPEEEDDSQRRRKRARKSQEKQSSSDTGVFQSHPLNIILQVFDDDEELVGDRPMKLLTLKFEYLHKLNVVCAGIEGDTDQISLLANLFPDDTGIDLPNQAAKLVDNRTSEDTRRASRWFKWAQHLAGLDFLSETSNISSANTAELLKTSVSAGLATYRQQHRVHTVLQQLRNRKRSQLALKEQLDALQLLTRPAMKSKNVPWASYVSRCQLKSWRASDGVELGGLLLDSDAASREDGELPPPAGLTSSKETNALALLPAASTQKRGRSRTSSHAVRDMDLNVSAIEFPDDEDLMDHEFLEEQVEEAPAINESKAKANWKEHGCRHYVAVLRREDQSSGRIFELEALVKLAIDYPARPPLFQLRLLSGSSELVRPTVPAGVADVVEESFQGVKNVEWFNQLRAMEAKINVELLPKSEEDYVLAHQMALLGYLFDNLVDSELAFLVNGFGARIHRGRERRTLALQ